MHQTLNQLEVEKSVDEQKRDANVRCPWSQCIVDKRTTPRLAVIIPFRERFTELQTFLPHLSQFLHRQNISHSFYIVNQVDNLRFNRGALLNAGYIESFKAEIEGISLDSDYSQLNSDCKIDGRMCSPQTDYLALHDVDLLPMDPALNYSLPSSDGPHHLIPSDIHPRYYYYKPYFGGIVLIRREQFNAINGMSNSFWGWGEEDDEFRLRVQRAGLKISASTNLTLGMKAFVSIHNEERHVRDNRSYSNPNVLALLHSLHGGLSTTNYTVDTRHLLEINRIPALLINVRLRCNMEPLLCNQEATRVPERIRKKPRRLQEYPNIR